ncbi:hypothetical protein [Curvivirga sp.]|uniref:hypothetical protein n=1 Tax=Curvivirga sp. TaxID=2856848 RepID=UPI003B5B5C71
MWYRLLSVSFFITLIACTRSETISLSHDETVEVNCLPIYGNWCGEGYPAYLDTGFHPEPVDVWDQACMSHDICYDQTNEDGRAECDLAFTNEIDRLYQDGYPVPAAMNAAYMLFNKDLVYRQIWISLRDVEKTYKYSCRGGDGQPALFCDVGMGRDNCEVDLDAYVETGKCSCDYAPTIWDDTVRKWGTRIYSAIE